MDKPKEKVIQQMADLCLNEHEFLTPNEQNIFADQKSMLQLRKIENEELRISIQNIDANIKKREPEIVKIKEELEEWSKITATRAGALQLAEQAMKGMEAELVDAKVVEQQVLAEEVELKQKLQNTIKKGEEYGNRLTKLNEKLASDEKAKASIKSELKALQHKHDKLLNSVNAHSRKADEQQRLRKEAEDNAANFKKSEADKNDKLKGLQKQLQGMAAEHRDVENKYQTKLLQINEHQHSLDGLQGEMTTVKSRHEEIQESLAVFQETNRFAEHTYSFDEITAQIQNSGGSGMLFTQENIQRIIDYIVAEERALMQTPEEPKRSRSESSEAIPLSVTSPNPNENRPGTSKQALAQQQLLSGRSGQPVSNTNGESNAQPPPQVSSTSAAIQIPQCSAPLAANAQENTESTPPTPAPSNASSANGARTRRTGSVRNNVRR